MSNEFHNWPQSRRGHELYHSRYTTELETRGTIEDDININEYESLSFDPKVPSHPRRPSRIQVHQWKSSLSSYRQDGRIARKREVSSSTLESPLAQAQRLQSRQYPGVLANVTSNANRFMQAGLSATMDQFHQATEPYSATKNKGNRSRVVRMDPVDFVAESNHILSQLERWKMHAHVAQSTSLDVHASALHPTKQRTPRNIIDLCDEEDDDDNYRYNDDTTSVVDNGGDDHEVSSDLGQVLHRNPSYASPRTHTETDATGYIKLRQSTNGSRPHSPIITQQRSFTLKKTSSFPTPSHSPTRGSSPTPKRRQLGETTGNSSTTPPVSQDDRKRERKPLSHAISEQIHLAQRPKVDFSNTYHSPATEVLNHTKVWDVETSTTRRSTSTVALQYTDSDDEDHHPRPKKKQKIGILKKVEGVTSAIGQWFSPKAKKKRLDKTKRRLIGFSEGTPTHQLPDDLRSTIHGSTVVRMDPVDFVAESNHILSQLERWKMHAHVAQSTSLDVLASALLPTKQRTPRNTIDLCDEEDDDDDDNYRYDDDTTSVVDNGGDDHEVSSDLVRSVIRQWLPQYAKKKRLDKTKGRLIGFSEGTPTHQLPDDLRSTIHGSNPQKGDNSPNQTLNDKSKSLRQVAEAIEDETVVRMDPVDFVAESNHILSQLERWKMHAHMAQSTSLDVHASALHPTKQRTPRNTIDLCDEEDSDNDDAGYIKLLQSTKSSRPHSPIIAQQRSFILKKTSSFPTPSHSPTRGSSPTPKRRQLGDTTGHSSTTPPVSQDDRKRERNPLSHAVSQQIHLARRPKVDFSNTHHSPAKTEVLNHTKVWDVETSTTRRSTSTVALQDTDRDDEDHHPRPKKKQKIGILKKVEGVISAIGQWLFPKAKKRRLDKTKRRLIGFSEGTPTHQLPDDLRSTIHGSTVVRMDPVDFVAESNHILSEL